MKLTPDSPEITAYALGEVNAEEHALIEHAIAESPELRAEIASLRRLADTLETDLSHEPSLELDPVRRDTILEAAADPSKAQPMAAAGGSGGGPLHFFSQLWTGITRPVLGFSLAAATALSTSLAEPRAILPQTPSLAGLMTSRVFISIGSTHWPSI
jgi:anti-sigma factor RsiW